MNQPMQMYCPEKGLQNIVRMMKSVGASNVTLMREGSGDSGDRAEFLVELLSGDSGDLWDAVPNSEDFQKELESYLEFQEGVCEACYENEGGRFECNVTIYAEDGEEFVLSAGGSSFHGRGTNLILSEELSVETFEQRFSEALSIEQCRSFVEVLKGLDKHISIDSTTTESCANSTQIVGDGVGRLNEEQSRLLLDLADRLFQETSEVYRNDTTGGTSLSFDGKGTIIFTQWEEFPASNEHMSFSEKYSVQEDILVRV